MALTILFIGTATYPEDGHNAEKLLQVADTEMYCQKILNPDIMII